MIMLTYARRAQLGSDHTELFIYATGLQVGYYNGTSIVGCLVGSDVYQAKDVKGEVYNCQVTRKVVKDERVSLVLEHDTHLGDALLKNASENVEGLHANNNPSAFAQLDDHVKWHMEAQLSPDKYVRVLADTRVKVVENAAPEETRELPRYEICMATQMKTFSHLLEDWISYHRKIGVDMVYVFDNNSPTDLNKLLGGREDVEVINWPWGKSQTQALSFMLIAGRARCEWLLLSDADEYVMIGIGKNGELAGEKVLKKYMMMRQLQETSQLHFPYLTMAPSGHVYIAKEPLPEVYIHVGKRQKVNGKTMSKTDRGWMSSMIHSSYGLPGTRFVRHEAGSSGRKPVELTDAPYLIHYQRRSLEEVLMKVEDGAASVIAHPEKQETKRNISELSEPPSEFIDVNDRDEYTHFRDIWRNVVSRTRDIKQRLVIGRGARRCVAEIFGRGRRRTVFGEECSIVEM